MTKVSEIFKYIRYEDLAIESAYQRPPSPQLINRIAKDFQPDKAWPLRVNFRDGRYYVVDGQHRLVAGHKAGIKQFLCHVQAGKSLEEEAQFFWETQSKQARRNLTAFQLFNARVASQEPVALRVKELCENVGIHIAGHLDKGGDCQCVSALEDCIRQFGTDALVMALNALMLCWSKDKNGLESIFVMGMCFLFKKLEESGGKIDFDVLRKNLTPISPADVKRMAAGYPRVITGGRPYRNIAAAFRAIYVGRYKNRHIDGFPSAAELLEL